MKLSLQVKFSQNLALTPQLQQSIRLLQLSTLELQQEVEQCLEQNPLLERADDADEPGAPLDLDFPAGDVIDDANGHDEAKQVAEALEDMSWGAAGSASGRFDDDDEEKDWGSRTPELPSLRVHLLRQLGEMGLGERDRQLSGLLVDALDEDGYLTSSLEEVLAMLAPEYDVEYDDLKLALHYVQLLDPAGVGAHNLVECLLLQLLRMQEDAPTQLATRLVKNHLSLLGARDYSGLKRKLSCSDDELRTAQKLIARLDPKPGRAFSGESATYVVPDVVVRKIKGEWVAMLNSDAVPKLRVNRMYARILQQQRREGDGKGLQDQLQEARWMVKNVQQRFTTILRVARAIVARQWKFFEYGEMGMSPLVLREIAEELGLHESTVSRTTNQKYLMSPRGIFELKYFFGSGLETDAGGETSATAVRALIKQLIGTENTQKPLSDNQLAQCLEQQGMMVARRTVAKYREAMQIPVANLRRML